VNLKDHRERDIGHSEATKKMALDWSGGENRRERPAAGKKGMEDS